MTMNYSRIKAALNKGPRGFDVLKTESVNGGSAVKVLASFPNKPTEDVAAAAVETLTGNSGKLIPGTFRNVRTSGPYHLARMIIGRDVVIRPFSETASMQKASSTMYIDSASHIWSVVGNGDNRHIVLQDEEDLEEVLQKRSVRLGIPQPSLSVAAHLGDFASVLTMRNEVISGYVFVSGDTAHVLDPARSSPIVLPAANIFRSINPANVNPKASINLASATTARNELDLTVVWNYLKRAWEGSPELVEDLRNAVNNYGP